MKVLRRPTELAPFNGSVETLRGLFPKELNSLEGTRANARKWECSQSPCYEAAARGRRQRVTIPVPRVSNLPQLATMGMSTATGSSGWVNRRPASRAAQLSQALDGIQLGKVAVKGTNRQVSCFSRNLQYETVREIDR